jgi:hypothetical protein
MIDFYSTLQGWALALFGMKYTADFASFFQNAFYYLVIGWTYTFRQAVLSQGEIKHAD